jgi:spore maturation protein CgeB
MRIVMFYQSLLSDWNHGNAHFLRGVAFELLNRGHTVEVYEPRNGWSLANLRRDHGDGPLRELRRAYPGMRSIRYDPSRIDLKRILANAHLAIVHEWSDHDLVARIGELRRELQSFVLLFHDTHHRAVTDPRSMAAYDLHSYDAVLAFGNVLRDLYLKHRWARRAFTWHEAADTRIFHPLAGRACEGDLVWVGNWGDNERTAEIRQFLLRPVDALKLKARVHGVRYPAAAVSALKAVGIEYAGWLANFRAPEVFARFKLTVHIPRRPYVEALPGIPTIRVFEALACGIPLVCAPWKDVENLFTPGRDYLTARDSHEMIRQMRMLLNEPEQARQLVAHAHRTILSRHTCAHRVDELLNIVAQLDAERPSPPPVISVQHAKRRSRPRRPTVADARA